VPAFRHFIERLAFHVPVLHDWLAERDNLRRKTTAMKWELQTLGSKYDSVLSRLQELEEFKKALWMPPGHFYSPIPAIKDLEASRRAIFSFPRSIDGIELNEDVQLDLLNQFGQWYKEQPFTPGKVPGRRYFFDNPNFSYADAIVLYCMMRHLRPRRIVEVGSGYSSCAMLDVNELFFEIGRAHV